MERLQDQYKEFPCSFHSDCLHFPQIFPTESGQQNMLVIANTLIQQYKRQPIPGYHQMVNTEIRLSILFAVKDGEALYSQQKQARPGADCGSDHEFHIAKFSLKLKKVRKTTRPFRYDLNQILYDDTVEAMNRFKRLDLVDRVPEELQTEV